MGSQSTPFSSIDHPLSESKEDQSPRLQLKGVSRRFDGGVQALDPIDVSIHAGEFLAILGPSGCGKSTLLRMIARLDRPTTGTISGVNYDSIAYVFQDAHLLPWRNVL